MKTSTVLLVAVAAVAAWMIYKRTPNSKLAVAKPQAPTPSSVASGFGSGLAKGAIDAISGFFQTVQPSAGPVSTADVLRDSYAVPDTSFDDPSAYG